MSSTIPQSDGCSSSIPTRTTKTHPHPRPSYTPPDMISLSLSSLLPPDPPRILFALSTAGHDPTEMAVPWHYLSKELGWHVDFATETGELARADEKLIEKSMFRKVLGASVGNVERYYEMVGSKEFQRMKRFGGDTGKVVAMAERIDFKDYDAVVLPGGHDKTIVPWLTSNALHQQLVEFLPLCKQQSDRTPSSSSSSSSPPGEGRSTSKPYPARVLAAICHGVLTLTFATYPSTYPDPFHTGKPLIHDLTTTTLPQWMEGVAHIAASYAWRMGNYMRTFEDKWTEGLVCEKLDNMETQWVKGPMSMGAFTAQDPKYHYVSGRNPSDARLFAEKVEEEIKKARSVYVHEVAAGKY